MRRKKIQGIDLDGGRFQIEGIEKLEEQVRQLKGKVKVKAIYRVLKIGAKPVVKAAKNEAPVLKENQLHYRYNHIKKGHKKVGRGKGKAVAVYRKGNLKRSIGVIPTTSKSIVLIGPRTGPTRKNDGYYGHMVHDGTIHQEANPFMKRAKSRSERPAIRVLENQMAKAIQKEINKLSK